MKRIAIIIFTTLLILQIIVFLLLYLYSNSMQRKWILNVGQQSQEDLASDTSSIPDKDKMAAFMENSTELASLRSIRTECSQVTFRFVSHVTQPFFEETSSSSFLLVLVISGVHESHRIRRNCIRSSWGNEFDHQASRAWKRMFILGTTQDSQLRSEIKNESAKFNDILVLDIEDNYFNLVIKTYSGLLWGMVHVHPRYILKADDDVFVRIPRLISWLDYYGAVPFYGGHVIRGAGVGRADNMKNRVTRDCMAEDYYASYCSGAFYVVSSNALSLIFQSMYKRKAIPVEDAYMGLLARDSGLKPVDIPGFYFRNIKDYGRCGWASAVAFGHGYEFLEYNYIEKKLQEHNHLPRYYYQCLMVEWTGFLLLFISASAGLVFLHFVLTLKHSPSQRLQRE